MRSKLHDIQTFRPAEYKPGIDSHVRYYAWNPNTEKLERLKIRINHIEPDQRARYAAKICRDLNEKLYSGWSPFTKDQVQAVSLLKIADEYLKAKSKELRPNSMRSYRSFIETLKTWLKAKGREQIRTTLFDRSLALQMMNDIFLERGSRTFNNYITGYRSFWNWMIEYQYCKVNPFREITKKKTTEKDRTVIDKETRALIAEHLRQYDPPFLFVCYLIFYCLIRPNEITYLKPGNFNLRGSTIYIPPHASKNRKGDRVTIPDVILLELEQFVIASNAKQTDYLFSDRSSLFPGKERLDPREFTRRWSKLRKELKLPKEYQLYSLKDSGIVQMLEDGVPPNEVMLQARHEDLATTTYYLKFVTEGASYQVRKKARNF